MGINIKLPDILFSLKPRFAATRNAACNRRLSFVRRQKLNRSSSRRGHSFFPTTVNLNIRELNVACILQKKHMRGSYIYIGKRNAPPGGCLPRSRGWANRRGADRAERRTPKNRQGLRA
eukprot:1193367-Prorocentrum_minimum.AAC.4